MLVGPQTADVLTPGWCCLEPMLLRILAFAGLVHLHDVLCKRTRASALGQRTLLDSGIAYAMGVAPMHRTHASPNTLNALLGWNRYDDSLVRFHDVLRTAECIFDDIANSTAQYLQASFGRRQQAVRRWRQSVGERHYCMHSTASIRPHALYNSRTHYTSLPHNLHVLKGEIAFLEETYAEAFWWTGAMASHVRARRHFAVAACRSEWKKQVAGYRRALFPTGHERKPIVHRINALFRIPRWFASRKCSQTTRALVY